MKFKVQLQKYGVVEPAWGEWNWWNGWNEAFDQIWTMKGYRTLVYNRTKSKAEETETIARISVKSNIEFDIIKI